MSTITDTNISKTSYASKDFASIYPEMLDLASQLTNKWDPSQSNESDPGVVLLKEAAFIADHNNYNIDKNILENFLPSATQDKSVRNITEMGGYVPRYYVSASGNVSLKWTYDSESEEENTAFTIPAFTLVISDTDNTVTYTQVEDVTILGDGQTSSCRFMEGTLQTLTVNDSSTITYDNLDDNNRIYLPESMVAQNGIYISNINSNDYSGYWSRDNYLLTRPNESRIYKIDYDSSQGLPYIEFPSDIANIIGDGITIKYFTTSGVSGNVSAGTLNTIVSPSSFAAYNESTTRSCDNFTIANTSSITNGKDPETINEMYKSYKKIVGTFDTLVSCKDYQNIINTLEDSNNDLLVSNSYVTDRRTDYNKSLQVVTYDEYKEYFKIISLGDSKLSFKGAGDSLPESGNNGDLYYNTSDSKLYVYNGIKWADTGNAINLNNFAQLTAAMSPYDLVIYALTAFSMNDYTSLNPGKAYNASFKPVSESKLNSIKNAIEENKCISHTYNDPNDDDIFCFKNYIPLEVTIQPFNKVTSTERSEILNNVYKALSENFNPTELEFGTDLEYDTVRNVIVNSDSRINDAYVKSFDYTMKAMTADGEEHDPYTINLPGSAGTYKIIVDMIAKNVLAGRVCLFNIDDDFSYKYGQVVDTSKNEGIMKNVTKISTELTIPLEQADVATATTETIVTERTFVSSEDSIMTYWLDAPNKDSKTNRKDLANNNEYTLKNTDKLILNVTNSKGKTTSATYQSHDNVTYTIVNTVGQTLVNAEYTETSEMKEVTTTGTLIIKESTEDTSTLDSTVNLSGHILGENECVQIISPNYYSTDSYGSFVNYRYEGTNTIKANTEHTLTSAEKITLLYTSDGVTQAAVLQPGDIVKTSFDLSPTSSSTGTYSSGTKKTWTDAVGVTHSGIFNSLSSSQTIDKRELLKTVLDSSYMMCYWIIDSASSGENRLFEPGSKTKILENGDYFIYANSKLDEMVILGSGTKLTRANTSDDSKWVITSDPLDIEVISENGSNATLDWKVFDFSKENLEIQEMSIVTLGQNDTLSISGWTDAPAALNNDWVYCTGTITYSSNGTATTLTKANNFYQIRSRLDLATSSETYQELGENQKIEITHSAGTSILKDKGTRLQASCNLSMIGGANLNLSTLTDLGLELNLYAYETTNVTTTLNGITENLLKGDSGYVVSLNDKDGNITLPFSIDPNYQTLPTTKYRQYILPVYIQGNEIPITAKVLQEGNPITIREFNSGNDVSDSIEIEGTNMFYIEIPLGTINTKTNLQLVLSWTFDGKTLQEPEIIMIDEFFTLVADVNGNTLNENLAKCGATSDTVCGRIREIIDNSDSPSIKPYYTYTPDNSMKLEDEDFSKPTILWDKNNVANIMSIPQIDFENSKIDIASSMRNY